MCSVMSTLHVKMLNRYTIQHTVKLVLRRGLSNFGHSRGRGLKTERSTTDGTYSQYQMIKDTYDGFLVHLHHALQIPRTALRVKYVN